MKCPVCNNKEVDIMFGCGIQNCGQENEKVIRTWGCVKCKSVGDIEYVISDITIISKRGVRVK